MAYIYIDITYIMPITIYSTLVADRVLKKVNKAAAAVAKNKIP